MKRLSIRNQLAGTVQEIVRGPVVSEVVVKTAAGTLASVITTRSVRDLKLKEGDHVFVMVKATEAAIQRNAIEDRIQIETQRTGTTMLRSEGLAGAEAAVSKAGHFRHCHFHHWRRSVEARG